MADDTTLDPAAAAPAAQPADQAVPSVPPVSPPTSPAPDTQTPAPAADAAATAVTPAQERLWAGKFKSPEVLEESYQHLQAEGSRMAQRLAAIEKQVAATAPPAPQTYTPDQLDEIKFSLLQKQAEAIASGDTAKAAEYAGNIVWCDREARKADLAALESRSTASTAYAALKQEVTPILAAYKDDLVPGRPLYDKAMSLYQQAIRAGAADNEMTATSAVLLAANLTGKTTEGTTLKAQTAAVTNLNQTIKAAAAAGSGGAINKGAPPVDFNTMSDRDFEAYRAQHGLAVKPIR